MFGQKPKLPLDLYFRLQMEKQNTKSLIMVEQKGFKKKHKIADRWEMLCCWKVRQYTHL